MTVNSKIAPYFRERNIKLNELSVIDLQNYYAYEEELKGYSKYLYCIINKYIHKKVKSSILEFQFVYFQF